MSIENERLLVAELNIQLQYRDMIASRGAVMTLPAATADLKDWLTDQRKFVSIQYDDWSQVISDFCDSVKHTGQRKLASHVAPITAQIQSLLPTKLITPVDPAPVNSPVASSLQTLMPHSLANRIALPIDSLLQKLVWRSAVNDETRQNTMNQGVRSQILRHVEHLERELVSDAAIIAAWRDLAFSADKVKRTVEEVAFRRDTLYAIAQRRNLYVTGPFSLFDDLRRVVSDVADAVQEELDNEAGHEHVLMFPPPGTPSGHPTWRRLELCERILTREPRRGNCIVWLRLAPASLPQLEVTHGQVTLYSADVLSSAIRNPASPQAFNVMPSEVLVPPPSETMPSSENYQDEWADDSEMVCARVTLPGIEIHTAEAKAKALVEGLVAVNHPLRGTWQVLKGSILFVDGERHSFFPWGAEQDVPEMYLRQNDRTGQDIAAMSVNDRSLNAQSLNDLEDAIRMATALTKAVDEDPDAIVMAAVRAIEHVNAWTTRGVTNWADFASDYFKKSESRGRIINFISYYVTRATKYCVGDVQSDTVAQHELAQISSRIWTFVGRHEAFDRRAAADHVPALHRIYADHWLARGLRELEVMLATTAGMYARLEEHGRQFDRHMGRLKRLRNAAIHGGPVSEAGCQSVAGFAFRLGHHCLNQAMRAMLTGDDIPSYMNNYRDDQIERYERIRATGDIDALFLPAEIEPG